MVDGEHESPAAGGRVDTAGSPGSPGSTTRPASSATHAVVGAVLAVVMAGCFAVYPIAFSSSPPLPALEEHDVFLSWWPFLESLTLGLHAVGLVIGGLLADRIGRRPVVLAAATGTALCSVVSAFLHTAAEIGSAGLIGAVLVRALGEALSLTAAVVAVVLALEAVTVLRRSRLGPVVVAAYPLSVAVGTAFAAVTGWLSWHLLTAGDLTPWFQYGFAAVLALLLVGHYLVRVAEPLHRTPGTSPRLTTAVLRPLLSVLLMGVGAVMLVHATTRSLDQLRWLLQMADLPLDPFSLWLVGASTALAAAVVVLVVGNVLRRHPPRPVTIVSAAVVTALTLTSQFLLEDPSILGISGSLALIAVVVMAGLLVLPPLPPLLAEQLPTRVRASGLALALALPIVIGSTTDLVLSGSAVTLAGGGLLVLGAYLATERRHASLADVPG